MTKAELGTETEEGRIHEWGWSRARQDSRAVAMEVEGSEADGWKDLLAARQATTSEWE